MHICIVYICICSLFQPGTLSHTLFVGLGSTGPPGLTSVSCKYFTDGSYTKPLNSVPIHCL